jgi:hypothetical protein
MLLPLLHLHTPLLELLFALLNLLDGVGTLGRVEYDTPELGVRGRREDRRQAEKKRKSSYELHDETSVAVLVGCYGLEEAVEKRPARAAVTS